jgi:hypothetical protein
MLTDGIGILETRTDLLTTAGLTDGGRHQLWLVFSQIIVVKILTGLATLRVLLMLV